MLKEALQYIIGLNAAREDIAPHVSALPDSVQLHDLEKFQPHRRRFRGRIETHLIQAFSHYHAAQAAPSICFINTEEMKASSYFDLGNITAPGHGEHRAVLTLKQTAEMRALHSSLKSMPVEQKALAEFLEEFRGYITASDDNGNDMPIAQVIQAVRKIEINATAQMSSQVGNFDATTSAMEKVELQSQRLPAFIGFTCIPYFGLSTRTFTLRLSLITGDKPKLALRMIAPELALQEMAEEFQQLLTASLPETTTIHLGTFVP